MNLTNLFELILAKVSIDGYTLMERKNFLTDFLRNDINVYKFNALLYMLSIENRITLGIHLSRDLNSRLINLVEKCTSEYERDLLFEYKVPVYNLTDAALHNLRKSARVAPPSAFQFMVEQYLNQIIKK